MSQQEDKNLPEFSNEIVSLILSNLLLAEQIRASQVCSRWNNLINSNFHNLKHRLMICDKKLLQSTDEPVLTSDMLTFFDVSVGGKIKLDILVIPTNSQVLTMHNFANHLLRLSYQKVTELILYGEFSLYQIILLLNVWKDSLTSLKILFRYNPIERAREWNALWHAIDLLPNLQHFSIYTDFSIDKLDNNFAFMKRLKKFFVGAYFSTGK